MNSSDERRVYADFNATTPLRPEVREAMIECLGVYGNASSMHTSGRDARKRVEEARDAVEKLIGAGPKTVIFTSGGSESNNTVFNTMLRKALAGGGRNEIVTSGIEHPCVFNAAQHLQGQGLKVTFLKVDGTGKIDMEELKRALNEKTLLVSVMLANNEIGTVQDLAEISRLAKAAGAWVHTDAVQAVGKIPVDVDALGVDYLTMSAHKIYGPKGVGGLYVRKGAPLVPFVMGGHQEEGFRAGTYNNLGIMGFGTAAKVAYAELENYRTQTAALRDRLYQGLSKSIPNMKRNGHGTDVLPNTLNVSFPGAEGEAILLAMDFAGIEASTGSACASGSLEPSPVLMATGLGPELAHGSIRFSLGWGITEADIDYIVEKLPPIIARLRAMSSVES
ncbi:MAG: cysteine desulfurase [Treponema sp.]|nr:cysteine desulfurase [Treponema sp.]